MPQISNCELGRELAPSEVVCFKSQATRSAEFGSGVAGGRRLRLQYMACLYRATYGWSYFFGFISHYMACLELAGGARRRGGSDVPDAPGVYLRGSIAWYAS